MKKSFLLVSMLLSTLCAFADENVLQTIQIEPIRDTYNVVLISDKAVDVKKSVEADSTVVFSMKGIRASEMLNTVYNGTAEIDSVIVTPKGKEELEIRVKGDNVERATVTFDSLTKSIKVASTIPTPAKKEIVLNKPMATYAPVVNNEIEEDSITPTFPPIGQKIVSTLKKIYANQSNRNTINFGLLAIMLFYGIKLVRSKETEEIKVGLAQGLAEREINLYRQAQTPVTNNFTAAANKPYTSVNYGLNTYRNVNKNPYERSNIAPKAGKNITSPISRDLQQALSQATALAEPAQVATTQKNSTTTNIDNLKFLETMTAIYEKSGRHDLAQGIKANLSKVK